MPNRILREGINDSESVNAVSEAAELFYRKLMSIVDDYGRCEANAAILLGKLYALRSDRTTSDIEAFLNECSVGPDPLLTIYRVGRKRYLQINKFGQPIRSRTKYPEPVENKPGERVLQTSESNCQQLLSLARATNTHSHTNTNTQEGGAGGNHACPGFDEQALAAIVEAYPVPGRGRVKPSDVAAAIAAEAESRGVAPEEVLEEILAGIRRWKAEDYRWQSGRVHLLKNFLADRMWLDQPLPVHTGSAAGKRSKTAWLESRLAELKGRPPPEAEHAASGNGSERKTAGRKH